MTGANRGIGREIAAQLRAAGVEVLGTAREPGAADVRLDVIRQDQIDALAARVENGLDILVNNAGVSLRRLDAESARHTLDVNFFGAMRTTDALLPRFRKEGRIVMVSSGMGHLSILSPALRARFADSALDRARLIELMESFIRDVTAGRLKENGWPSGSDAPYSVSKVGLNALTRVLARELAGDPRRILVNAVSPGWVRTRMGGAGAPRSVEQGARTPVWLALSPEGGPTGGFFEDENPISW